MPVTVVQYYRRLSEDCLRTARTSLIESDLIGASEMGWEAAAAAVRACAEARGLDHNDRRELHQVVTALVKETGDTELYLDFGIAGSLETNSLEDWHDYWSVGDFLSRVEGFSTKLGALI